jgi:hypothetical protein
MDETEPPLRSDETDDSHSDAGGGDDDDDEQVRFEDLTVNDDLPLLDRVVRYTRSQIALQRLCHVKMLAETAELAGYVHRTYYYTIHYCVQVIQSKHKDTMHYNCLSHQSFLSTLLVLIP